MKLLAIALLMAFPSIIFAQTNYQQGYVLKKNGDTLKGYINYHELAYSPLAVEFKIKKDDKAVQRFAPSDIKAFQITGFEDYVAFEGAISTNKNIVPDLPYALDTTTTRGAVFLKPITNGRHLALFYNNEPGKDRFFISEANGGMHELKYYPYYDGIASRIVDHYTYRGQLLLYNNEFNNGNVQLADKINDVMFNEADLKKIVNLINNNGVNKRADNVNVYKKISRFRLFAGVGANSISSTYTYGSFNPAIQTYSLTHTNSVTPKISLGADLFVDPPVQRLIFRFELSYASFNSSFTHSVTAENATIRSFPLGFTERTITVTPQAIFNVYNKHKLKIYLDAGGSANSELSPDNNPVETNGSEKDHVFRFRPFWSNYLLQAGVVLNRKIEFAFSFTNPTSILTTFPDNVKMANSSTCLSVRYLFDLK
jgi:hypothetical protein